MFVDELQAPVHGHDCLRLVLLQQHRANLLVDVCIVVEEIEFLQRGVSAYIVHAPVLAGYLLDRAVLLLLRLKLLARLDFGSEICSDVSQHSSTGQGSYLPAWRLWYFSESSCSFLCNCAMASVMLIKA